MLGKLRFAKYLLGASAFAVSRFENGNDASEFRNRRHTPAVQRPSSATLYRKAARQSEELCELHTIRNGLPGVCIAVSINGRTVWKYAFGYADLENGVRLRTDSVMRIASISKCFTAVLAAKLYETKVLDLDARVQRYVPEFPEKFWPVEPGSDGRHNVEISVRQLLSHQSGIRHYSKTLDTAVERNSQTANSGNKKDEKTDKSAKRPAVSEFDQGEYYLRTNYKTVSDSLSLFKDDPLLLKPGSGYLYTTHGFTLAACALERADTRRRDFLTQLNELFCELGLRSTYPDLEEKIVPGRTCYYRAAKADGRPLTNAPFVDNSYKWAGGGLLSNCGDLLRFANALLYSFQNADGVLKQETVCAFWQPQIRTPAKTTGGSVGHATFYALGFVVGNPHLAPTASIRNAVSLLAQNSPDCKTSDSSSPKIGQEVYHKAKCAKQDYFYVEHSGGAVGATSILLIVPDSAENLSTFAACNADLSDLLHSANDEEDGGSASLYNALIEDSDNFKLPNGVCVAILCNMQSASGLSTLAHSVGELFMDAFYKHKLMLRNTT